VCPFSLSSLDNIVCFAYSRHIATRRSIAPDSVVEALFAPICESMKAKAVGMQKL